jgi:hypothetical protein
MLRRSLLLLGLLFLAANASAAWYPRLDTGAVRLEVGETTTVGVHAIWTGLWIVSWRPWYFESTNPSVARVTGEMPDSRPGEMRIAALKPGRADAVIEGWTHFYRVEVTVVCGHEDPIAPASPIITTTTRTPIALRAVSNIADRFTFTWYHGRTGDTSFPIGQSGPEIVYVTNNPGEHHVWVMATSPCSTSTTEFTIEARPARRRTSRP